MRFIKFLSISYFMQVQETQRSYQAKNEYFYKRIISNDLMFVKQCLKDNCKSVQ
jgi:hypothetical protein